MSLTLKEKATLRDAGRKVRQWTTERDRLIAAAVGNGHPLREIGTAVGLSHQAVKFIAEKQRDA